MPARIAYAVGLAVAIALAACYDVPRPECGFTCGPPAIPGGEGTCPDGYVCATTVDNRCHRASPPFTDPCPGDASIPPDLTPPVLHGFFPADGATGVDRFASIEVWFDEPVDIEQFGRAEVRDEDMMVVVGGVFAQTGIDQDGIHYQFAPDAQLRAGAQYRVTLTDQIADFNGNHFPGASWTFTTAADTTPPMVFLDVPVVTSNVPVTTQIQLRFSEQVAGVGTGSVTLSGPSGNVGGSVVQSSTLVYTFDPFSNLQPDSTYTITVTSAITDFASNPLATTQFTFTTEVDVTPPFASVTPTNTATAVPVTSNVIASFSEVVSNVTTSTFTLTGPSGVEGAFVSNGGTSASLNPAHQLVPFTTYTVSLTSAIVDASNNALTPWTSTFTTGADTVPPTVIGRSPALFATNVPVNTVVRVDFDEDVTNANATTIQVVAGGTIPATVSYQGAPFFRATLTLLQQLAPNATYTVQLAPTLQDTSGNMFGTPPTAWTFTTGPDMLPPTVRSTVPADNAIDVAVTDVITVTFDEPVTGVDATSFVVMNAGTGTVAAGDSSGFTWVFTPDAPMPANTNVTILLTTAIHDGSNNALAAPVSFDFTTAQ